MEAKENKKPVGKCVDISPARVDKIFKYVSSEYSTTYHLRSEIYYGYSIPEKETKYSIIIKWGEHETEPLRAESRNRLVVFNRNTALLKPIFPHKTIEDCPDIFVYFLKGSKIISYIRRKVK